MKTSNLPVVKLGTSDKGLISNSIYFDEISQSPTHLSTNDLYFLTLPTVLFNLDESYDSNYEARLLGLSNFNFLMPLRFSSSTFLNTTNVLNSFRADFEDFSPLNTHVFDAATGWAYLGMDDRSFKNEDFQGLRLSNPLALRSTARNSIVTFNALQKVFRARFEDGRSHASLEQFSNLSLDQPFLNTNRVNYEGLLSKTKNTFFHTNFFNPTFNTFLDTFTSLTLSLNYHFFSFPFLLSAKSDMSRYV